MRLPLTLMALIAVLFAAAPAASAQDGQRLPIPIPDGARVRLELNTGDEDLLGVVKSLLRGINGQALMAMMSGVGMPGPMPPGPEGAPQQQPDWMRQLAEFNLADVLKDVHQFRLVALELPEDGPDLDRLARFYEEPFRAAGGRRMLWADFDEGKFLMVHFPEPRGWAAVLVARGVVIAARADGYPDLEGIPALFMLLGRAYFNFSTGPAISAIEAARHMAVPTPAARPTRTAPAPRPASAKRSTAPRRR